MTKQEIIEQGEDVAAADAYISIVVKLSCRGVKAHRREIAQQILALLGEHGELHTALLERQNVTYPLMLAAVRNLVSQRYLRRVRRETIATFTKRWAMNQSSAPTLSLQASHFTAAEPGDSVAIVALDEELSLQLAVNISAGRRFRAQRLRRCAKVSAKGSAKP